MSVAETYPSYPCMACGSLVPTTEKDIETMQRCSFVILCDKCIKAWNEKDGQEPGARP